MKISISLSEATIDRIEGHANLIKGFQKDLAETVTKLEAEQDRCKLGSTCVDIRTGKTPRLLMLEAHFEFTSKCIASHEASIRMLSL